MTVPIALVGVEAGHALANAAFGSPEGPGEIFASTVSGSKLVPPLVAVALGALLLGVAGSVTGHRRHSGRSRSVVLPFACLPPLAFVLLEAVEGAAHTGAIPWDSALEPTFLVGLALQLPFALAGYLLARALLQLSDGLRSLIVGRQALRARGLPRALRPPPHDEAPHGRCRTTATLGRAPPGIPATS